MYVKDQLITNIINSNPNKFFILNLDDYNSITNGTHWVAFYYNKNKIEYFDSYGLKPPHIIASKYPYTYNNIQYQLYDSKARGYFCLYFIYHLYHNIFYYNIVKRFSLEDFDYSQ